MSLGFTAPALLAGALAALIPLLLHLVRRRPPHPTAFPAMVLLLGPTARHARRRRLRDLVLLATRMALVFVVAATLAGPFLSRPARLPPAAGRHQAAVIVMDDTLSMRYRVDGVALFETARRRAMSLVEVLPPSSPAALITVTGQGPQVLELSLDRVRLRRAIGGLQPTMQAGSGKEAVARATRILAEAPSTLPRAIYLVTDGTRTGLSLPPGTPPAHTALVVLDVAGRALPNHAVVGLEALDGPNSAEPERGAAQRFRVTLRNATSAKTTLGVRLHALDLPLTQASVTVPAHATQTHDLTLSRGSLPPGALFLEASLASVDGLSEDDRRLVPIGRSPTTRALLVDGDPRETPHDSELFYLEAVLEALTSRRSMTARVVTSADLDEATLNESDLVVLANVAAPTRAAVVALVAFVRRGGALLVALGDQVDPDAYNQTLGPSLLPARLRTMRSAGQPGAQGSPARVDVDHIAPVLREALSDPAARASLRQAQVSRYALLDQLRGEALLRLDTGAPLLLSRPLGAGRVLLWTSTLDRDWTDLVHRPAFLPLVEGILGHLAGGADSSVGQILAGRPAILRVPAKEHLVLRAPGGALVPLPTPGPDGHVTFLDTRSLGGYRVYAVGPQAHRSPRGAASLAALAPASGQTTRAPTTDRTMITPASGQPVLALPSLLGLGLIRPLPRLAPIQGALSPPGLREIPSLAFAVVTDPAESDLRRHDPMPGQAGELGASPQQGTPTSTLRVRDDLTRHFALWCLLLLFLEGLLAARFRRGTGSRT